MRLAGLAVAALVLLLVPSAAQAGSVDHQPGSSQLSFTGTGAETNTTTITLSGGVLSVSDATSGMGQPAGSNCTQTGPGSFDCPAAGVTRISVSLGAGNDTMTLNASTPSTLNGDDGNDAITGGSGPDTIDGGNGNDTIDGGAGDDVVSGGPGPQGGASDADKFTGGSGSDTITYAGRTAGVTLTVDGTANDGAPGEGDNVGSGFQTIVGGDGGDHITGGAGAETVDGGKGSDVLDGGDGNDVVDAGSGDASPNTLSGGNGDDTLRGAAGTDTLDGGSGNDALDGGSGADSETGGSGNDDMTGGIGNDVLTGGPGDDTLRGGGPGLAAPDGADVLDGGDGNDKLSGGDDNDALKGGAGADDLAGGPGTDTADYSAATGPVAVTLDDQAGDGQFLEGDNVHTDVEDVAGGGQEDTFTGDSAPNVLDGGGGENFVDGGAGADEMRGGAAADTLVARDGGSLDKGTCGGGFDFVIADRGDGIASDCEVVDRFLGDRPILGRIAAVLPHGRQIAMRVVHAHRFVPLTTHANLPMGSSLDATTGAVRLTIATGGRTRAAGSFNGGAFLIKQRRRRGAGGELTLSGGDFSVCGAGGKVSAAARPRRVRHLFARTHGRFSTRGRNSTATSRGTVWSVTDRCDGTLTKVVRGTVTVRDLVKRKTVVLHAGQAYLARVR